jgi:hypothetical protein
MFEDGEDLVAIGKFLLGVGAQKASNGQKVAAAPFLAAAYMLGAADLETIAILTEVSLKTLEESVDKLRSL